MGSPALNTVGLAPAFHPVLDRFCIMQKHTITCPFCARKMGVGPDLLGRQVRCPHCKQAVTAPRPDAAPAPGPSASDSSASPSKSDLTPTVYTQDLPVIQFPGREGAESIFGEPEDDEVFSSSAGTRIAIPEFPPESPQASTATGASSPPAPVYAAAPLPAIQPVPAPIPDPATSPIQTLSAPVAAQADVWAEMSAAPVNEPAAAPSGSGVELSAPAKEPRSGRSKAGDSSRRGGSGTALAANPRLKSLLVVALLILVPYSLLMTALAAYGLAFRPGIPDEHPLSTIPDDFGEFPAADRKKVSKRHFSVHGELPPELKVAIGTKLAIGVLEIEPAKIEVRPLTLLVKSGSRTTPEPRSTPALVLTLRIHNRSADLWMHPMDPAFTRKARGSDQPATGLEIGAQKFWGGAIDWPLSNPRLDRVYEKAQETDAVPLGPGETRDYVVFTDTDSAVLQAVEGASVPMLWRVQVRRGLIKYRGEEVPVTAIIGVEFQRNDVNGLG